MTLFKHNLILKAKSLYRGNWLVASQIFELYDYLVDLRDDNLHHEAHNDVYIYWYKTIQEHRKHIELDETLVDDISTTLRMIKEYIRKARDITKLLALYRMGKYKQLIHNLIMYMVKFYKAFGISIKPIKVKSDTTGMMIYALTPNTSESETYIEQETNINTIFKKKVFNEIINSLGKQELIVSNEKYTDSGVPYHIVESMYYPKEIKGFLSPNTPNTIYPTLEELEDAINLKRQIDDNYDQLIVNSDFTLANKLGEVMGQLEYLDPKSLKASIDKQQKAIIEHNSNLKPYENKIPTTPQEVKVGDHVFKVFKVFYKNLLRPVIIEGKFKGVFLDQMISSTGKVLESGSIASPYFTQNKQVLESLGDTSKLKSKETSGVNLSVVSKRVQKYQSSRRSIPYDYVKDLKALGNVLPKKVKDLIPDLMGMTILNDIGNVEGSIVQDHNRITSEISYVKGRYQDDEIFNVTRIIQLDVDGKPEFIKNELFTTNACLPDGLGTKVFTQQVIAAQEAGIKYIKTYAANEKWRGLVGYYVWPKFGYNTTISPYMTRMKTKITSSEDQYKMKALEKWFNDVLNKDLYTDSEIVDIYACKVNGKFIGQELWLKYGDGMNMEFDLTPGSLSMRILDAYITLKAKKEGVPVEQFLNTSLSKYEKKTNNLKCLLEDNSFDERKFLYALKIAIKNHENGEVVSLLGNSDFISALENLKKNPINKPIVDAVKTISRIYKANNNLEIQKLASTKIHEDPMLKELDMDILNQIWDNINKEYES